MNPVNSIATGTDLPYANLVVLVRYYIIASKRCVMIFLLKFNATVACHVEKAANEKSGNTQSVFCLSG